MLDVRLIIEQLKEGLNLKTDKDLCEKIGVPKQTLSGWKSRNSIPLEMIFDISQKFSLDLNWLITGKENAPKLNEMETELLARFNRLSFSEKLDIFNRLQGSTAPAQSVGGDGFNVGGDFNFNQK